MSIHNKPTDELEGEIGKLAPSEIEGYLKSNKNYRISDKKAFYYYFKDVIESKNIMLKDVYCRAGVSESYGSKIVSMEKHTKDRELILRLCMAGHFNWEETNRALKLYGMSELYAKDKRDAVFIVAINNRIYDMYDVDELLISHGLEKLSVDEK
jgi:hypothetical protein